MYNKNQIYSMFTKGSKPTEQNFRALIDFLENEIYKRDLPYVNAHEIMPIPLIAGTSLNDYFRQNTEGKVVIKGKGTETLVMNEEIELYGLEDVTFENINFTGYSPFRTFKIDQGSKRIRFINCKFYDMKRVINIYTASDITVKECDFDYNGYCILGMFKYSHSNVKVIDNNVTRARADFVEMNCDDSPSEDLIVTGNTFHGSSEDVIHETHLNREQRFVGVTGMKNVIITNNIIKNTFASAIHSERMFGTFLVQSNVFENCVIRRKTQSGNRLGGVIEISGNSKDIIINGNHFIKNPDYIDKDGHRDNSCFLWFNYHQSTRPLIISNNIFDGQGLSSWTFGTSKQSWCSLSSGGIVFNANKVINSNGFDVSKSNRLSITNCQFDGPIFMDHVAAKNLKISNSTIYVKDEIPYSIYLRETTPSQPLNSKNIIISDLFINKPIMLRYPENVIFKGVMMPESKKKVGNNVIDGILELFPNSLNAQTCNIVHGMNLLAKNEDNDWDWLDPIPDEVTEFPDDHPLYG